MSFAWDVKRELFGRIGKARHCELAELAAIVSFSCACKCIETPSGRDIALMPDNGNSDLYKKYAILIDRLFGIKDGDIVGNNVYKILESLKLYEPSDTSVDCRLQDIDIDRTNGLILQQTCCKRAYVRGAFLSAGTISDPNKSYHFEITCRGAEQASQLVDVLASFEITALVTNRKGREVVYLKDSSKIVDILSIMEAHRSLMELENVRIVKEVREGVNRKVNCETANIYKTINASVRQIDDIEYIRDTYGLSKLPDTLEEIARVRLQHPDDSLEKLGTYLAMPIGKSGVNHRMRRINRIAEELRRQED